MNNVLKKMYRKKGTFGFQKSLRFNVNPFFIVNLCYKSKFEKMNNVLEFNS